MMTSKQACNLQSLIDCQEKYKKQKNRYLEKYLNIRALKQNVHKASFILSYFFLIFKCLQPYPLKNRFKTNGSKGGLTQFLRCECDKMGRE